MSFSTRGVAQGVGHLHEQTVARRVAQRIVDDLEIVQVDVKQRAVGSIQSVGDGGLDRAGEMLAAAKFGQ